MDKDKKDCNNMEYLKAAVTVFLLIIIYNTGRIFAALEEIISLLENIVSLLG